MAGECVALNSLTMVSSTAGSGECSFLKKKNVFISFFGGGGSWRWPMGSSLPRVGSLLQCLDSLFSAQAQYL